MAPPTDAAVPIPRLFSLNDLSRRLSITKRQIHRWLRTGEFPQPIWLGRKSPRWTEADLAAWFAAQRGVRYQPATGAQARPKAATTPGEMHR